MPLHESNISNILEDIPKENRKSDVSAAAKHVFTTISKRFKELYQADFTDTMVKIPELGLAKRKTKKDFINSYRKFARKIKWKSEEYWNKNDTEKFLGNRVSYSVRKRIRHSLSFETLEKANLRAQDLKRKKELGLRKPKRSCKDPSFLQFDKRGPLDTVNGYPDGTKVYFEEIWHKLTRSKLTFHCQSCDPGAIW